MVYLNNIIVLIRFNKICLYIFFCFVWFVLNLLQTILFLSLYIIGKKRTLCKMVKFCIIKNFFSFYAIWGMARLEINLWRSWQAAISLGEKHAFIEPGIAEWDSYYSLPSNDPHLWIGNPLNWNILVGGGRENNCDAVSNVERKRYRTNWIPIRN